MKILCSEVKALRRPRSILTLSILPRFFKVLGKLDIPIPKYIIAFTPDGSKILYPTSSNVGIYVNLLEIYSEREYFLLDSHIPKRGDIIVDCGAYVGLYSIISSKLSGNDGKVVSIEPVPDTFELLKKNIQLNKLKNVRLFNIALADREGEAELFIPKFSAAGSTFFLNHLHVQEVKEYTKVRVRVVSFDEFTRNELKDIDHINIMKIDTEGAELPILHGMQNSLKRKFIDKLIIEIHKAVTSPKQVISFLIDNKYIIDAYFDINDLKGILYASASG